MKKASTISLILTGITVLLLSSTAVAHDTVIVVPLGGAVGDAKPEDVIQGKTFSSKEGKRLTGTLTQLFTINGDGTVTDNLSGLMWQQANDGNGYYLLGALLYCDTLDLGGYPIGSWRLPTKDELKGLVRCSDGTPTPLPDHTSCGAGYNSPTIEMQYSCSGGNYWSSSEFDANSVWRVGFTAGYTHAPFVTAYSSYVRCVR